MEKVAKFRKSKSGRKHGGNAARDLHQWATRSGSAFAVPISQVPVQVRRFQRNHNRARKVVTTKIPYPVLHLSSWFASIMVNFSKFFLGGFEIAETKKYEEMLGEFWANYESFQPTHPIYSSKTLEERRKCIPYALHGDEGRGACKVPLLVISFQVIIPYTGPENLSQSKYRSSIM